MGRGKHKWRYIRSFPATLPLQLIHPQWQHCTRSPLRCLWRSNALTWTYNVYTSSSVIICTNPLSCTFLLHHIIYTMIIIAVARRWKINYLILGYVVLELAPSLHLPSYNLLFSGFPCQSCDTIPSCPPPPPTRGMVPIWVSRVPVNNKGECLLICHNYHIRAKRF